MTLTYLRKSLFVKDLIVKGLLRLALFFKMRGCGIRETPYLHGDGGVWRVRRSWRRSSSRQAL